MILILEALGITQGRTRNTEQHERNIIQTSNVQEKEHRNWNLLQEGKKDQTAGKS
jgi:hypothetical protein